MDPKNPNKERRKPGKLEELAKEKLTEGGWYALRSQKCILTFSKTEINARYYASSNAGQSYTHLANRQAFYRHRIIPRQLVDTNLRDTSTTIFGHKGFPSPLSLLLIHLIIALCFQAFRAFLGAQLPLLTFYSLTVSAPIGFAPIGINKIYHPAGEIPVATVAQELNLPYCLSTAGSSPIEAVAAANREGPRFFQLYMPHDDELTISLLTRAHNSGFTACILTTDTWQLGWRHDDIATGNYAFYRGIGADLGLSDPGVPEAAAGGGDRSRGTAAGGRRLVD
ncbi:hypothetical protein XPA_009775 [Xanthoria parietina]